MALTTITGLGKGSAGSSLPGIFSSSTSPAMRMVERAAAEVAPTDLPIFIVGESGTGKGTLATMIHRLSRRSDQDLVKVNCQNFAVTLGADDNAVRAPLGLTGRQLRGTVLLDEVLELPSALQSHVMAILPEGDIEPHDMRMVPRVIAASRSEDTRALSGSTISRELYYRLRGVLLRIPPLRDRSDDIPLLAHFLLNKYAATFGRSMVRLSSRVEEQFQRHSWPGNVRELENAIKALLAVDDEDLVLESFSRAMARSGEVTEHPVAIAAKANGHDKYRKGKFENGDSGASEQSFSLKDAARSASRVAEKQLISEVLQRTSWNRKRAAKELNISYKALLYKLKQNGLSDPGSIEEETLGETSK